MAFTILIGHGLAIHCSACTQILDSRVHNVLYIANSDNLSNISMASWYLSKALVTILFHITY